MWVWERKLSQKLLQNDCTSIIFQKKCGNCSSVVFKILTSALLLVCESFKWLVILFIKKNLNLSCISFIVFYKHFFFLIKNLSGLTKIMTDLKIVTLKIELICKIANSISTNHKTTCYLILILILIISW